MDAHETFQSENSIFTEDPKDQGHALIWHTRMNSLLSNATVEPAWVVMEARQSEGRTIPIKIETVITSWRLVAGGVFPSRLPK